MKQYNFSYSNKANYTESEQNIITNLSNQLQNKTFLVEELLKKEVFNYDDINNLFDPDNEDDQSEIFAWYSIPYLSDNDKARLDNAKHAYISNEFGNWIARYDWGSARDLYFLPSLADTLFNESATQYQ